ncbi:7197_t:CDS:2 [Paraglomus occultum]|uniref:7197_t:CDS:1 n=1 Tax=Paraglomus occultum TaxID=144539 RepID=A0A9N8Z2B8_9GLOM|nr:7197_t:CDS:2 [Paraglomus occultum]
MSDKVKEITYCEVFLASPSLTIPTTEGLGLSIKGTIRFTLSAPLKLSQVVAKLHGYSQYDNSQKTGIMRNLNIKDIIKQKATVVNVAKSFPAGETELPFIINIKSPQSLLATVEGKNAAIRYIITVELTRAGAPLAVYKTTKNVILRKRNIPKECDINEMVTVEDEKENLLKYNLRISKYLFIEDTNDQDGDAANAQSSLKVEASFDVIDNKTKVKEVKVEAFEYEMYNIAKATAGTSGSAGTKPSGSKTAARSRSTPKIPAFSAISIPNPHHTIPLLNPPLTIPLTESESGVVKFEIPFTDKMKPDSKAPILEVKHEVVLTIKFEKFLLMPLKLEVPFVVATRKNKGSAGGIKEEPEEKAEENSINE